MEVCFKIPRYDVQDDSREFPLSLSFGLLRLASLGPNSLSLFSTVFVLQIAPVDGPRPKQPVAIRFSGETSTLCFQ